MAVQRDKVIASAEKLVARGKIEPAIKEYERLLDDNPNDVNTLNRIGDLWVRINRADEAVKVFSRIADHYSKDGFFLKAIAIFKKINKLDPSKLDIYAKLADLYAKQGLAMEAKSQYQVLADYYLKHGDPGNALLIYRKISELDPNSINVHVKLADLYSQNNQPADALKEYDRVGRMLLKRGMLDEAVQVFKKALKTDPKNTGMVDSLVTALLEAKDHNNARQIVDAALDVNKGNPRLLSIWARVQLATGDAAGAKGALQEALAADPNEPAVRESLADLHLRQNDADAALEMLAPIAEQALSRGERGTAIETLNRVLKVEPGHAPTLERLIALYVRLNEETNILASMNSLAEAHIGRMHYDEAAKVLERLIQREPQNAQHRTKLQFVRSQSGGVDTMPARGKTTETPVPEPETAPAPLSLDDDFALDLDASEAVDIDFGSPTTEPQEVPAAQHLMPAVEIAAADLAAESDDLDFITEHLTEAEVFAKYGLAEKAAEHLRSVLDRAPQNLTAHERLYKILLEDGDVAGARTAATAYVAVLRANGDSHTIEAVRSEFRARGHALDDTERQPDLTLENLVASTTPSVDSRDSVPAIDTAETEIEFDIEEPLPEFTAEDQPAEEAEESIEPPPVAFEETAYTSPEAEVAADPEPDAAAALDAEPPETEPELSFEPTLEPDEALSFEPAAVPEFESGGALSFDSEEPSFSFEPETPEPAPEVMDLDREGDGDFSFEAPVASEPSFGVEPEVPSAAAEPSLEELGEIDFYLEQELFDEAAGKLTNLEGRFPGHAELLVRQQRIDAGLARVAPPPALSRDEIESELLSAIPDDDEEEIATPPAAPTVSPAAAAPAAAISATLVQEENLFADEENFFDLAAELESELADEDEPIALSEEEQSLEEIFREFKKGVEQQLDSEDYDTHYNLGIAYKEMGLIDEAIGEFQLASKDPRRAVECASMLGLCFLEKGMPQLAIKWYRKGLEMPEITEEEHIGLLYDLGAAYQEVGDIENAQKAFLEVYGMNSTYRDIVSRMKQVEDARK